MASSSTEAFNPACEACPRLVPFLAQIRETHPHYHARPVAPFGVDQPELLIVGLAPGMHGANATGRPFTGDFAGLLLYESLYEFGFSSAPKSVSSNDDLVLNRCRITNAVKCLPPQNKPTTDEVNTCNAFLERELNALPDKAVILALGSIAHRAVLKAESQRQAAFPFGHAAVHALPSGRTLVDSYHTSRYNIQTRRLTTAMFHQVFKIIQTYLPKHGN